MLEPDDLSPPRRQRPPEANPGWKQLCILSSCDALAGGQLVFISVHFARICRAPGMQHLVYTGFATNMCIMFAAAGAKDMLDCGYLRFLIWEATHAVAYRTPLRSAS
jgi:hypothetical protein